MPSIQTLRQKIIDRDYYLSAHAEEEMWDEAWSEPTSNTLSLMEESKDGSKMIREARDTASKGLQRTVGPYMSSAVSRSKGFFSSSPSTL